MFSSRRAYSGREEAAVTSRRGDCTRAMVRLRGTEVLPGPRKAGQHQAMNWTQKRQDTRGVPRSTQVHTQCNQKHPRTGNPEKEPGVFWKGIMFDLDMLSLK